MLLYHNNQHDIITLTQRHNLHEYIIVHIVTDCCERVIHVKHKAGINQ